jgi:hypothetical protein
VVGGCVGWRECCFAVDFGIGLVVGVNAGGRVGAGIGWLLGFLFGFRLGFCRPIYASVNDTSKNSHKRITGKVPAEDMCALRTNYPSCRGVASMPDQSPMHVLCVFCCSELNRTRHNPPIHLLIRSDLGIMS